MLVNIYQTTRRHISEDSNLLFEASLFSLFLSLTFLSEAKDTIYRLGDLVSSSTFTLTINRGQRLLFKNNSFFVCVKMERRKRLFIKYLLFLSDFVLINS
jgi:hypothetical protein